MQPSQDNAGGLRQAREGAELAADTDIPDIRDASRRLVRELGFMRPTLAGTALHASAVHALIEIGQRRDITAADLADILDLEKSSISRMVRKLIDAGEVAEVASERDARSKWLSLTAQGAATLARIDAFATRQVAGALDPLPPAARRSISAGLAAYARALERRRTGRLLAAAPVLVRSGYRPGLLGRCIEMHGRHYAAAAGFGAFFEAKVAAGLAAFIGRADGPRNGIWAALAGGEIVGTIAIDGEDLAHGAAHLRWFIVDDCVRGQGVGRRLLAEALAFCDRQGFAETALWTFAGLDAARHLYETSGFRIAEEWAGTQWGAEVMEQRYVRPRPGQDA